MADPNRSRPAAAAALLAVALLVAGAPARAETAEVRVLLAGESRRDLVEVVDLARSAQRRLWLFAYTLSDAELVAVLREKAADPEFDLRVLMDGEQHAGAQQALAALAARVTPVVVPDEGRLHTKLMLIDDRTIVMGSKNWSDLANQAKWNDLVVLQAKRRLVGQVEDAFRSVGALGSARLPEGERPASAGASAQVSIHFSAPGRAGARTRALLTSLLEHARVRIHLGLFVMTDPVLVRAVWEQRERVDVRLVLDAVQFRNLARRRDGVGRILQGYFRDLGDRYDSAKGSSSTTSWP